MQGVGGGSGGEGHVRQTSASDIALVMVVSRDLDVDIVRCVQVRASKCLHIQRLHVLQLLPPPTPAPSLRAAAQRLQPPCASCVACRAWSCSGTI